MLRQTELGKQKFCRQNVWDCMEEIFNEIFLHIDMIPIETTKNKIANDFSLSEFPFIAYKSKT
jgi:hypothetical protein